MEDFITKIHSDKWCDDKNLLEKPIEYHEEITVKERRSRYIRIAFEYLLQEKGEEAHRELLDELKISPGSSAYQHIMNDDNWNSYLMEVWIMTRWIKFFDNDHHHYYLLGYHTVSGRFDKKSGLWETMFRLIPIVKILQQLGKTSDMMSLISQVSYRYSYNRRSRINRALVTWIYNKLPQTFNRPHLSTVLALSGILDGVMKLKGMHESAEISTLGLPLCPADLPKIDDQKYHQDDRGNIVDSQDHIIGNIKNRVRIGDTNYFHRGVSIFLEWPKEENIFIRLKQAVIKDKTISELTQKDSIIQKINHEHQLHLAKYKKELAEKTEQLRIKNEIMHKELDMAANIQQGIMKKNIRPWNSISFAAYYQPLEKVSGDYYDVFKESNSVFVLMADVSGHGVPAALITMAAKQAFNIYTKPNTKPSEIFIRVNAELIKRIKTDDYLTAFMLHIDETNKVTFSNASHPKAIHQKYKTNDIEMLDTQGLFISAVKDADHTYENKETQLQSGDRMFLYTDGLIEHTSEKGEEFGEERALKIIREMKDEPLDDVNQSLISALKKFMGKSPLKDDISIISLEINKNWVRFVNDYNRGVSSLRTKDHEQAIKTFNGCLEMIPSYPNTYYMLARTYFKAEQFEGAETSIQEFFKIKPNHINGLKLFIEILLKQGKSKEAIQKIEHLKTLTPEDTKLQKTLKKFEEEINNSEFQ